MSSKCTVTDFFCVVISLFLCLRISHSGRIKRIVNGMPVTCGTEPQVASLRNASNNEHLCGAAILSPVYAITAAHCVEKPANQYILQLRNVCVDDEHYPTAEVFEVITNENYDRYTRAHDLSILQITFGFDDVSWIKNHTVLPISSFGLSSECTIFGYGSTNPSTIELSDTLLAARVEIVSLDECVERLSSYVAPRPDSGMLCALGDDQDACQGDSGGPMFCDSLLQGVISYGQSCGVAGLPGVYTSIGAHLHWINDVLHRRDHDTNNTIQ